MSQTDRGQRRVVAVAPMRLSASSELNELPAGVADDMHQGVVETAMRWQQASSFATFWEMGASVQGFKKNWAYVLAGLMASTGEQLALAHAAAVEVALWLDRGEEVQNEVADEMSMRGMVEAQAHFLIATGHALANVALRSSALHPALHGRLEETLLHFKITDLDPFSSSRANWISMNPQNCQAIERAAIAADDEGLTNALEPILDFGRGKSWRQLTERRGEDFHRWRPQTDGVAGVPRSTPWSIAGRTASLGIGYPAYKDARGLAAKSAAIADKALLDMAWAMKRFDDNWRFPGSSVQNDVQLVQDG